MSVDVGTSGARATAFDTAGAMLLEVRRPYPTQMPHDGWAEQDAAQLASTLAVGARHADRRARTAGTPSTPIGLTGQCPSVVPIDRRGMPLRPGIIYRDNRAVAEAEALREAFGAE